MDTNSKHLLVELFGCNSAILQDQSILENLLREAAIAANVNIVQSIFHQFSPQGVTGVVIIEESHLSIHTWPEYNYASVDFYTCGDGLPEKALTTITNGLACDRHEVLLINRGMSLTDTAMKIEYHK